jgi:hypothetical protein
MRGEVFFLRVKKDRTLTADSPQKILLRSTASPPFHVHLAYSTARISRITVTLICPG